MHTHFLIYIPYASSKGQFQLHIINGRKWRMKLLRGSDNDLFLSGSTNISDDDSISDTSVSAEFEVAPYHFVPKLSAESPMKRPQREGRSWLIGWFKPRMGWKYTNWPHCTRLKTFG